MMKGYRTVVALGGVILVVIAIAGVGWFRVGSLDSELGELRSNATVQGRNLSQVSDELGSTRDELLQREKSLQKARQRAQSAQEQARASQDCVDLASDEDETGPQSVVFAFVEPGDDRELLIDEAKWYVGDEANREALKDGEIEAGDSVPNDYYIRNDDDSVASFMVEHDSVVVTTTADRHNIPAPKCNSWAQFAAALKNPEAWEASLRRSPYWLTVRNDEVVRIVEQYLP